MLYSASFLLPGFESATATKFSNSIYHPVKKNMVVTIVDFRVLRLSNARVHISWHTSPGNLNGGFNVLRKIGKTGEFTKIGFVSAKKGVADAILDYALIDVNGHSDSSFYSLLQVDAKGVKYYSQSKGVEGWKNSLKK